MAKVKYEKSIRISPKPAKNVGIEESFVLGEKQTRVSKPKSLTPKPSFSKKK